VPYFNGPIYLENKTMVGKVEEIFGPINASYFTVKMVEGAQAASYKAGDKFYIAPDKLLPMERFLQPEKCAHDAPKQLAPASLLTLAPQEQRRAWRRARRRARRAGRPRGRPRWRTGRLRRRTRARWTARTEPLRRAGRRTGRRAQLRWRAWTRAMRRVTR